MKTVKVKMLESVSGTGDEFNGLEGTFSIPHGAEVELPEKLAQTWVAIGRCEILPPVPEAQAPADPPAPKTAKK